MTIIRGGFIRGLLVFLAILVPGLIVVPNLQTTAHYSPIHGCLSNQWIFADLLETANSLGSSTGRIEVTSSNHAEIVARLEEMRKAENIMQSLTVSQVAVCPVTGMMLLTGTDPAHPENIVVCCKFHPDPDNSPPGLILPAFPTIDPQEIDRRKADHVRRFYRRKYFLGIPPDYLLAAILILACLAGYFAEKGITKDSG